MFEIRHYITANDKDVFAGWRERLRDKPARIAIDRRIYRAELGNFGDRRFCRDGVWELRIDSGPGYRVYYALAGKTAVLRCAAATRVRKTLTLRWRVNTGKTGRVAARNRRTSNERSTA
jgi:putative addiction module killer protein